MTVKQTLKVKEQINAHKKLLEKPELFTYSVLYKGNNYYHIRYSRFGKTLGNLILTEGGEVVSFEIAKKIFYIFDNYNTCITNATNSLAREKGKSVKVFEALYEMLPKIRRVLKEKDESIEEDIHNILLLAEKYISDKKELQSLYDDMYGIDLNVQKTREYLTEEDAQSVTTINAIRNKIIYDQLRKSRDTLSSFRKLYDLCSKHNKSIDAAYAGYSIKLKNILIGFVDSSNIKALEKSLRDFETDENGNPVTFSAGKEGLLEMDKMEEDLAEIRMEKWYSLLRNK